jgi:hypothetical protein
MQHRAMPLSLMTPIGKSSESNRTLPIEHVLSFLARFQKRSSMLPDNNTHLPMNNRYQQQCTPLMHLLVRLSIRGLRVLQGRRLRSANSRFPCVDLVTLRSSPYSIIDFSCQYGTSSWTMVLHARFAHNHVLRVHCLTFRRRLLLCLVKSPRSRALSDADGPWMEEVSLGSCSDHFWMIIRL